MSKRSYKTRTEYSDEIIKMLEVIKPLATYNQAKVLKSFIGNFIPAPYFTEFDLQVHLNSYAYDILGAKKHTALRKKISLLYKPQKTPLIQQNELLFAKMVLDKTVELNEAIPKTPQKEFSLKALLIPDERIQKLMNKKDEYKKLYAFMLKNADVASLLFTTFGNCERQQIINLIKAKQLNLECAKIFIDHYKTINENIKKIYETLEGTYTQIVIGKMVRKNYVAKINFIENVRAENGKFYKKVRNPKIYGKEVKPW